jgi:hypothetical protein
MKGLTPFRTWDETYVHTKLNGDIHVLQVRPESGEGGQGGDAEEPWTWVRDEGKGRVFYTAYGHDERTWGQTGFVDLIDRGTRWATRMDAASAFDHPKLVGPDPSAKPFEYVTAEGVPFYDPTARTRTGGGVWNQMPKPLPPEESKKHMILPRDSRRKLFVSEPDVVNPLTMAWDERGRLWVVESLDYPNASPSRPGARPHQDLRRHRRRRPADKFTVFAEGLNIPWSIAFCNGGVIVPEKQSTWFMKDTDGDGKADEKTELFTGWYPNQLDTHAGPNNFRYGLDNWFWGMVGYGSFAGEVAGSRCASSRGFTASNPTAASSSSCARRATTRGASASRTKASSSARRPTAAPAFYLPIPNRYYESVRGGWAPAC